MDLNVNKTKLSRRWGNVLLMTRVTVLVNHRFYINILGNEHRNILSMNFFGLLMTFIDHARQPNSEKIRYDDHKNNNSISHNPLPII